MDGEQPGEVWPWPEHCGRAEDVGELKVQQLLAGRQLQEVLLKGGGSRAPLWLSPFTCGARHCPVSLHLANNFGVSFAGSSSSIQLLKVGIPQARPSLLTVYFFPGPFQLSTCITLREMTPILIPDFSKFENLEPTAYVLYFECHKVNSNSALFKTEPVSFPLILGPFPVVSMLVRGSTIHPVT